MIGSPVSHLGVTDIAVYRSLTKPPIVRGNTFLSFLPTLFERAALSAFGLSASIATVPEPIEQLRYVAAAWPSFVTNFGTMFFPGTKTRLPAAARYPRWRAVDFIEPFLSTFTVNGVAVTSPPMLRLLRELALATLSMANVIREDDAGDGFSMTDPTVQEVRDAIVQRGGIVPANVFVRETARYLIRQVRTPVPLSPGDWITSDELMMAAKAIKAYVTDMCSTLGQTVYDGATAIAAARVHIGETWPGGVPDYSDPTLTSLFNLLLSDDGATVINPASVTYVPTRDGFVNSVAFRSVMGAALNKSEVVEIIPLHEYATYHSITPVMSTVTGQEHRRTCVLASRDITAPAPPSLHGISAMAVYSINDTVILKKRDAQKSAAAVPLSLYPMLDSAVVSLLASEMSSFDLPRSVIAHHSFFNSPEGLAAAFARSQRVEARLTIHHEVDFTFHFKPAVRIEAVDLDRVSVVGGGHAAGDAMSVLYYGPAREPANSYPSVTSLADSVLTSKYSVTFLGISEATINAQLGLLATSGSTGASVQVTLTPTAGHNTTPVQSTLYLADLADVPISAILGFFTSPSEASRFRTVSRQALFLRDLFQRIAAAAGTTGVIPLNAAGLVRVWNVADRQMAVSLPPLSTLAVSDPVTVAGEAARRVDWALGNRISDLICHPALPPLIARLVHRASAVGHYGYAGTPAGAAAYITNARNFITAAWTLLHVPADTRAAMLSPLADGTIHALLTDRVRRLGAVPEGY